MTLDRYAEQGPGTITTLRHRYRELGRLRIGEQRISKAGKKYPAKLDTFRFTSTDWRLIARVADLYGGEPETWADAPGWNPDKQTGTRQFQVVVEADRILVSIPAKQQLTQQLEYWTAAGCQRRCNGEAMTSGEECQCALDMMAGAARLCAHVTRANFILPNLPGLGVWRLESHGVFTASELPLQMALAARYGPDVQWWLRLDPRSYRTTDDDGKPITYHFGVPVLDTDLTPAQLLESDGGGDRRMVESSVQRSDPPDGDQAPPGVDQGGSDPTSEAGEREDVGSRLRPDRHDPASDPMSPPTSRRSRLTAGAPAGTPMSGEEEQPRNRVAAPLTGQSPSSGDLSGEEGERETWAPANDGSVYPDPDRHDPSSSDPMPPTSIRRRQSSGTSMSEAEESPPPPGIRLSAAAASGDLSGEGSSGEITDGLAREQSVRSSSPAQSSDGGETRGPGMRSQANTARPPPSESQSPASPSHEPGEAGGNVNERGDAIPPDSSTGRGSAGVGNPATGSPADPTYPVEEWAINQDPPIDLRVAKIALRKQFREDFGWLQNWKDLRELQGEQAINAVKALEAIYLDPGR